MEAILARTSCFSIVFNLAITFPVRYLYGPRRTVCRTSIGVDLKHNRQYFNNNVISNFTYCTCLV